MRNRNITPVSTQSPLAAKTNRRVRKVLNPSTLVSSFKSAPLRPIGLDLRQLEYHRNFPQIQDSIRHGVRDETIGQVKSFFGLEHDSLENIKNGNLKKSNPFR